MAKLLEGKNVIITGTRRGMGRAMLDVFAQEGAGIWAHARKQDAEFTETLAGIAEQYQVPVRPLCFELTDADAMKDAVRQVMLSKIPVDGLVNNAGITYNALFQMSRMEEVRRQMETNFFAPYAFTQYVSKLMVRNKKGSIVNIASTAAFDGNSGKSAYGASKAALIAMTRSIAEEMGKDGIRANCIAPGVTQTEMLETIPEQVLQDVIQNTDLRRVGQPLDIARTAAFLISDLASYVTAQTIRVDGGM